MIVTLPPPADLLLATDITLPPAGTVGEPPASPIMWEITNLGTAPAVGTWHDVLYLSADGVWDLADPVIDRVQHTGDVAVGGSYVGSTSAELPPVVPGDYHVIVRTDIRNRVRESEENNNWLASAGTIAMDVPELVVGVTESGTLDAGDQRYYRLSAEAGQDIALNLGATDSNSVVELYVRYGQMPDRTNFDIADIEPFTAGHEVVINGSRAGDYYVQDFVEPACPSVGCFDPDVI